MLAYSMLTGEAEQCCLPKEKEEEQPESFLTNLEAQRSSLLSLSLSRTNNVINSRAVEPRRRIKDSDSLDHSVERPKDDHAERQPISQLKRSKREIIDIWLSNTSWSRRDDETSPQESPKGMAQKPADVLSPPDESFQSAITFSKKSLKSVASVRDLNYRHSLLCRNIFIQREDPPEEMMQRAKKLISRRRTSPEIDDDAAEELKKEARRCQDKAEDAIAERLAAHIIPAMKKFPDSRLKMSPGQQWYNSVLIPLNSNVLITPLPLPKPKPNLAYGYSEAAFDEKQLLTIDLLIDDQSGRSYASPDQVLQFPFLDVEFKSQAKNETLYMATNQVAGAGAIALNGYLELICRSFGAERFDFDEPHFFSVAMDQDFAHVNVHWIGKPAEGGQYSFHVERLSSHVLSESNGLRSLQRAIKNILDYGLNVRLRTVCEALDALRQNFISERQAVNTERDQRSIVQTQPEPKQRARGKRAQLPSHNEQEIQGRNDPQVEESKKVKKSRGNKAQENMQPVRRSRRQQIMAQQEQSQVNDQTKATRPKRPFSAIHDDQEIWIWTGWNL